ncbi:FAD-binding oxidoreductase [Acuticoccus sp. MNP-M23]|uniref:FAD-binding oxidoreductase n=1 Tax=Acuticoccus sp. MNP-M23 TaxID=3072793 RepID=UPI0028156DF3|nr:FAD-binding oxidoreductase [Acuticoccus sp. MNP-M23]WMS45010.1 FAD-binding oxidoreductase [Acuticoccus sp. MNP-M23]
MRGDAIPARNNADWSSLSPQPPAILVRPTSTEDVAHVLRICSEAGMPVVPQGGLTGVSGGARPVAGCVALSMERFVGVENIDEAASTMTVRAGTPLEVVQKAAAERGLYFPLDLGARGSCAIGGNVSTNAGGNRVIRYGMTRDLVLGMEVVLPDGTVLTNLNKMLKNNTGYDLRQIFVGAEGTLGVVTRLVLRLFPQPVSTLAAVCGVADYGRVLALLAGARKRLGPSLSAFEVMWADYWEVAARRVPNVRDPLEGDHPFHVLVELQGSDEDIDGQRFQSWIEAEFEAGTVTDAALSQSLADVAAFWGSRDAASEFIQVLGPHLSFDISLSVGDMDAYAAACRDRLAARIDGCQAMFYGHIADGNMHIIAWVPGAPKQPDTEVYDVIYGLVREYGGSVSAEHGIGLTKKNYLSYSRSEPELALMRTIKRALDPGNIMNPGKVFDMPATGESRS